MDSIDSQGDYDGLVERNRSEYFSEDFIRFTVDWMEMHCGN